MTLADVHLAPLFTVPPSLLAALVLLWLWMRVSRAEVPAGRRRVRRVSIALMLLALPPLVRGTSFIDPALRPREYLVTWSIVIVLVLLVLVTAAMDVAVSLRLHRELVEREMRRAADDLVRAARHGGDPDGAP